MSSYIINEQCYQTGGHGKFGSGAVYKNENLRGPSKANKRKHWLNEAINHYKRNKSIKGISYNERCHSVYLHSEIDQSKFRNRNNATFKGRPSKRHKWHTLIIFNH